jgi:hypothetical protein
MTYAKRLIYIVLISTLHYNITYEHNAGHNRILSFNDLKHFLAYYESSNGKFKYNLNTNGTVDCGLYQINSSNFVRPKVEVVKHRVGVDSIFAKFGIGSKFATRVTETIRNDSLCACLAEYIYNTRGLDSWTCYPKFKQYLEGYIYHVSMSTLQRKSNGVKRSIHKGSI